MNFLEQLLSNKIILCCVVSWALAQTFKFVHELYKTKKFSFDILVGTGGFPSSHTSFVVSLAGGVGFTEGFDSTMFAISLVLSFVVMYDAMGIRRAAGEHAKVLNDLVLKLDENSSVEERLEELLGHTPLQVVGGVILGTVVSILMFL